MTIRTCSRSNFENNVSAFEPRLLHNGLYQKWVLQNMLSLAFLELNPLKPLLRGSPFALRLPARHGCVVPPCVYSLEAKIKKLKNKLVMISEGQLPLAASMQLTRLTYTKNGCPKLTHTMYRTQCAMTTTKP